MSLLPRRHDPSASEILKARGITRLVYFHTDHFEPWRYVPGRPADFRLAVDDLNQYIQVTRDRDFARRATLFFKPMINNVVDYDRRLWRADPHDAVGFVPLPDWQKEVQKAFLDALDADKRPLELHIHHENTTWNDRPHDELLGRHLADPANRRFDEARFELMLRLNLDMMKSYGGFDRDRWFFVHGHWALNGADPHVCTIVREIEILRRNGCLGDFTQPSGRPHTNSRVEEPYLARPVARAKGYDRPEADPIAAAGAGSVALERFLVWASKVNHRYTSIDHYSRFVQERMEDPELFARHNAQDSFAHDGVLYVKTHAHTMHPAYWKEGSPPLPHAHPGIIGELGALFDAADKAGAEVAFPSVKEVVDGLLAAPAPPMRDLVALYRLQDGHPMDELGCDVEIRDRDGPATLPPLSPLPRQRRKRKRKLVTATPSSPPADAVWATIVELPPPPSLTQERAPLSLTLASDLEDAVAAIASLAQEVLPAHAVPGGGAPDLSVQAEMAAALESAGLDRATPLLEIGCGPGLLAVILSARGWTVSGIDADAGRIADAKALAQAAERQGLLTVQPSFVVGSLPGKLPAGWAPEDAVAIAANPVGPEGRSGQAGFVRALTAFRGVLIDLNRFYVLRSTQAERARLIQLFDHVGFEPPQLIEGAGHANHFALFRHIQEERPRSWPGRVLRSLRLHKAA